MAYIRKSKGKLQKNLLLTGVSGQIGKTFIVKQYKDKTVLSAFPDMDSVKPSAKQKEKRKLFQGAVAHAKAVLDDPKQKALYVRKLKGKRNVFQAAMSDYLKSKKQG